MGRPFALTPLARYRWAVGVRSMLAVFGGYALAAAFAACLGLLLARAGMARVEAVTTANMLAFIAAACVAMWVFGVARLRRACIGMAGAIGVLALGAWLLRVPA